MGYWSHLGYGPRPAYGVAPVGSLPGPLRQSHVLFPPVSAVLLVFFTFSAVDSRLVQPATPFV